MAVKPRVEPKRMCAACREMFDKSQLVRIVRSPEGELSLDTVGKKPGRGAYICHNEACWKRAKKSRSLEKALKTKIPDELWEQLEAEIPHE